MVFYLRRGEGEGILCLEGTVLCGSKKARFENQGEGGTFGFW